MGFDNECILNIQSLAGEYFCPVCRLLVYPNEALQSQCTHLYCKPCLTYVVSTTRACPYDGYLVTEADSKPLVESNKALAETIGKITVHCLYHRSGCAWQGPLSECTSHCSECAFGNSPVVCNRCGVQIVHRQVQEHAQNCPGVQPQANAGGAQAAAATGTAPASDQNQATAQVGSTTTQAQPSQITTTSVPGQDTNQQANQATNSQSTLQTAVPTAEQWYQQQQQYQQYYQQYPGYDPYQQHYQQYYPYQQQTVPQYPQSQVYVQPQSQVQPQAQLQMQPQAHPQLQLPAATQPLAQPPVNLQPQTPSTTQPQSQLQTHPPPQGQPPLQAQMHQQTNPVQHHQQHIQAPPYQQPHSQVQHPQQQFPGQPHSQVHPQPPVPPSQLPVQGLPQTHAQHPMQPGPQPFVPQPSQPVNPHLQAQHSSAHAVTGHQSYPQPQSQHQVHPGGLQNPVHYPPGGPHPQFPQQSPLLRAPQSHVPIQNPQQSVVVPSSGQTPNVPPAQQPVLPHSHQPGMLVNQRPVMQSAQQPIHQQYLQQHPFTGQPLGPVQNQVHQQGAYMQPHQHGHSQLRPQGPSQTYAQPLQNVASPHGTQPHQHQAQNLGGRHIVSPYGVPTHAHPHLSVGMQVRTVQIDAEQQSGNAFRTNNQLQLSHEQHPAANSRPTSDRQGDRIIEKGPEPDSSSQKDVIRNQNDLVVASGLGSDAGEVKTVKSENDLDAVDGNSKSTNEAKDILHPNGRENLLKNVKEEPKEGTNDQKHAFNTDHDTEDKGVKDVPPVNSHHLPEGEHLEDQSMKSNKDRNASHQHSGGFPLHGQVQGEGLMQPSHSIHIAEQQKQQPPLVPHGPSGLQQRQFGSSSLPEPPPAYHMQLPGHPSAAVRPLGAGHIPHGPEVAPAGIHALGSTPLIGRGGAHYGPQGPFNQVDRPPYGHDTGMFPNQRPNYPDGSRLDPLGHQSGMHSNAMRMNAGQGMSSPSAIGLRDDRFRPFLDEHMNLYPQDVSQRIVDRREFEDLKNFPRHSDPDIESTKKLGGNFPSWPLDKRSHGPNYEPGMKLEGGPAPSRFFPPYHHDGLMHPTDMAERPIGFRDSTVGRQPDSLRAQPEFFGPVRRYDRWHRDGMAPRSPGRDYPGVPSHGFGPAPSLDDIDGRESRRFGDSFHGTRFPVLPSSMRMGEFEGPGQDGFPNHFRRGEHLGHHNLHGRMGEPIGFGAFPGPAGKGDLSGTGNFFHSRYGEPGFRSSYSLKEFSGDGGKYTGELDSFDNPRRRKSASMGWCRICKVDCDTVEGLDLHSQTKEHQKMAMDIVLTIKQNVKKQKIGVSDPSLDDASKQRNVSIEGRGNKN